MYKLIRPNRGWVRVLWHEDARHPLEVSLAFSLVDRIPGCQVGIGYVELPYTAWHLDEVKQLMKAMDLDPLAPMGEQALQADWGGGWQLWEPCRPLYPHQVEAAARMVQERGFILADDMGVGKTATAIVAAETLRGENVGPDGKPPGIVIAPKFTRDTWRRELLTLGAATEDSFCVLEGRDAFDRELPVESVDWYFIHYDIVRDWWSRLRNLKKRPIAAIVDEAHHIKNGRTQRAKGTLMVASAAEHRFLLTGTPMESKPADLWNLLSLATGTKTWGGPLTYRKRYAGAVHNGYGYQDIEPTNTSELKKRLEPFYLRRTAEDVKLDLPELTRTAQHCDMRHFQIEHDAVLGSVGVEQVVRALVTGAVREALPVISRLRKLTSLAKFSATLDYVNNLIAQGESVVVFCWERETAKKFYDATLEGDQSYLVTGDWPQDRRDWAVNEFQRTGGAMIATYGALREGVTLHRARIVVMHDLDWRLTDMLQAEKRIHRIGQKRGCQSVWMVADNSIDSLLLPVLSNKATAMQDVLGVGEGVAALQELQLVPESTIEHEIQHALSMWEQT